MQELQEPPLCFHGGALYKHIGDDFRDLKLAGEIIDADVLDAWFGPSPKALRLLSDNLLWSIRCSPPVVPRGVEHALSKFTGIPTENLVCGAGSSSLMFLALRELLNAESRVLILDPTYGEYAHILDKVIGCKFDSFKLSPADNYVVELSRLIAAVNSTHYDLVILVNPNNPSGQLIPRNELQSAINLFRKDTIVWIDEAYIDYAGSDQSLGTFAATRTNVIVCKSLSKALSLSGLRVAYLSSSEEFVCRLKLISAPWSLSLPAQLVLTEALTDRQYYEQNYWLTHKLRLSLHKNLQVIGFSPRKSTANFILVDYPRELPPIDQFQELCREHKLLLRDVSSMGKTMSKHCFRVAVKDAATNERIIEILQRVKNECYSS